MFCWFVCGLGMGLVHMKLWQDRWYAAHPVLSEDERLKYFLQGRNQQKLEQVAGCAPPWVLSVEKINGIDHFTCAAPAGEWSCSEHGCRPIWKAKQ